MTTVRITNPFIKIRAHAARFHGTLAVLALIGALGLSACSQPPRQAQGKLDTPDHHVLRGYDLIDQERWSDGETEFNLALSLDKDYAPAMSGLAVVKAHASSDGSLSQKDKE